MKFSPTNYLWSPVLALYYYLTFEIVYLKRFGEFNWQFDIYFLGLLIIGFLSVLLVQYYARRLGARSWLILLPFIVALPLSVIASLGGGLLGLFGLIAFGLLPFVIIVPLGYKLIRRLILPQETPTSNSVSF